MKRLRWSAHARKIVGPNPNNLMLQEDEEGYLCHYYDAVEEMADILKDVMPMGPWLSAALDDPNVCDEMKADINRFLKAIEPFT